MKHFTKENAVTLHKIHKTRNAWAFYDWANSVYPLVITSAIFPIFYTTLFQEKGWYRIEVFGIDMESTSLISFISAFGFLIVSIISPILSGIADYTGNKKIFMKVFCYIGAGSCMVLYVFNLEHIYLSLLVYLLALIGFWGSQVFYNSYLPDIAPPYLQDSLSAKGYSLGYIGSVIFLGLCLVFIMMPESFGLSGDESESSMKAMRLSFIGVGLWWIIFSQYTYFHLPRGRNTSGTHLHKKDKILKGFKELKKVYIFLKSDKLIKSYLQSFFIYSMGVQTVMLVAIYFGEREVDWGSASEKTKGLIISILVIQLVAVIGAILTSKASHKFGNFRVLMVLNFIWIGICVYAFFIVSPISFYIAAVLVGLVMGGIQSLSRSTYSKLLKDTKDTTSFFSFYDVSEKIGIVIGMGMFGLINQITGSSRNAMLFLATFFLAGFLSLIKTYNYGKKININI